MAKATIKLALIGCGAAAEKFYLPYLAPRIGSDLEVIIVDLNKDRAAELAESIGAETATSILECSEKGAQGAILATPHHLHHEQAIEAMELGLDLLIEKPVAINATQANNIRDRAKALNKVVMVNNNRRLFPSYREVAKALASNRIGNITKVEIEDGSAFQWPTRTGFYLTSTEARGVLLDRGAHTIDILSWWLAGPMEVVKCEHDGFQGADALVRLWLKGPRDEQIALRFSRLFKLENQYHITGDKGEIRGRLFNWNTYQERIGTAPWREIKCNGESSSSYEGFVEKMIEQFVNYLRSNKRPEVTIEDVVSSIELLDMAYSQATLFELPWYKEWTSL